MLLESNATRALRHPSVPYVLPFVVFLLFLAIQHYAPLPALADMVLRAVVLTAVLAVFSRHVISFRLSQPVMSVLLGAAVFALWIAPDALFPNYRHHWLFENPFLGPRNTSMPPEARGETLALVLRTYRAAILVPIIEELFWRAWLMRWLINPRFEQIRLGTYAAGAFWITAALFASEHGPYWDVGLMTGVLYNWWMVRTRSLGDCIVAHATTNLCLSLYVIASAQWQYWL